METLVKRCALVAIGCGLATVLNGDVIEDFENGNTSNYSIVAGTSDNLSILPGSARR